MSYENCTVAVVGEGLLVPEISLCLLRAGHTVVVSDKETGLYAVGSLAIREYGEIEAFSLLEKLRVFEHGPQFLAQAHLAILVTSEAIDTKRSLIRQIETQVSAETLIAVNTESFSLHELQELAAVPNRIIGLNWVRPAHQTLFSELITLPNSPGSQVQMLLQLIKEKWNKDPYVLEEGRSVRARLLAAMIREAFYLVENGYVSEEDIDRACRNDAGYYLPFAGNFRYMDLMGTYAYGLVMEELNPDLCKSKQLPAFFEELLAKNDKPGMDSGKGFYTYQKEEREELENSFLDFSKKIRDLMDRYPFPLEIFEKGGNNPKDSMTSLQKNRSME